MTFAVRVLRIVAANAILFKGAAQPVITELGQARVEGLPVSVPQECLVCACDILAFAVMQLYAICGLTLCVVPDDSKHNARRDQGAESTQEIFWFLVPPMLMQGQRKNQIQYMPAEALRQRSATTRCLYEVERLIQPP